MVDIMLEIILSTHNCTMDASMMLETNCGCVKWYHNISLANLFTVYDKGSGRTKKERKVPSTF